MDAYLAIVDRSGLRALLTESPAGMLLAAELRSRLPSSVCYWIIVEESSAAILRELLDEGEASLALRLLQSQARDCGPAQLDAASARQAA